MSTPPISTRPELSEPAQYTQQSAPAAAGRAENRHQLPLLHREIDPSQGVDGRVPQDEVFLDTKNPAILDNEDGNNAWQPSQPG